MHACRLVPGRFLSWSNFFKQLKCTKSDGILCDTRGGATRCEMRRVLVCCFRMVYINSFLRTHSVMFLTRGWTPLKGTSSVSWFVSETQHMLLQYSRVESPFCQFFRNFSGPSCVKADYPLPGVEFNPG